MNREFARLILAGMSMQTRLASGDEKMAVADLAWEDADAMLGDKSSKSLVTLFLVLSRVNKYLNGDPDLVEEERLYIERVGKKHAEMKPFRAVLSEQMEFQVKNINGGVGLI